MKGNLLVDWSI